ncbi:MAG: ribonuclease III [Rickettsiales bacterium]|nr:ribonuclease III [Pseudomonadota bacterium]MDA0966937.1 ribonuclease III [Pseudomonadota bacterium]MDG4543856.1 ribonuclease III [Rickettsiales bacterium]MDG4546002.1 ribonuclease III [Rickettsiales bacterium]MDG4548248.1 ribonuclease III [Rickettsiales bacterium]
MVDKIEKALSYSFKDHSLLEEALTHPSISKQRCDKISFFNYERFEFLGDAVLGLVIAELLINKYPEEKEGSLAKRLAGLVRGEALVSVARKLNIGEFIKMTQGEEVMGGRDNSSNIENTLEAIIGAIYIDSGLESARDFISRHWIELVDNMKEPPKDPKTELQEWSQGRGLPIPEYKVIKQTGPSHDPFFEISVKVEGVEEVTADGNSKKKAEKNAAKKLLKIIKEEDSGK